MTEKYPNQFPHVTREHRLAIAHLVLQWSSVDDLINLGIEFAAWKTNKQYLALEVSVAFKRRMDSWNKLAIFRFPEMINSIESVATSCFSLHDIRSDIIHGHWTTSDRFPNENEALSLVIRYSAARKFRKRDKLTSEKIEKYAIKISRLHRQISEFYGVSNWFHA